MASYRYERNIRPEDLVQEPPRVLPPKERRVNWSAGWYAWQNLTAVRPDYVVTVVSRTDPAPELLEQVQAQLETVGSDENGDGRITVEVNGIWLDLSVMQEGGDFARLMESSQEKLNAAFYLGESRWTTPPGWNRCTAVSATWTGATPSPATWCGSRTSPCRPAPPFWKGWPRRRKARGTWPAASPKGQRIHPLWSGTTACGRS